MRIIGLTGGIASGKSTVARVFEENGIPVIDADQLARDAVLPGTPALGEIAALFGSGVLNSDGTLNRQLLGARVFSEPQLRKRLEAILHPAIKSIAEERLAELRRSGVLAVIYMAPLLIEAGVTGRVDEIWVVYADRETQIARVMARDGLGRAEAEQRLAAQMPMEQKAALGKIVISNMGSEDELRKTVMELCRKVMSEVKAGQ